MKITDVKIGKIKSPLKRPFKTALRTTHFVEDLVLKVTTDKGLVGYGSCTQTPTITGETIGSLMDALLILKENILNLEFHSLEKMLNRMGEFFIGNTSALACFDMALHDVFSQSLNMPLYQYLGGDSNAILTNLSISCQDVETMIADSLSAVAQGFYELKVKVGKEPESDFERILEISKAVGPRIKLRVDANQGWLPKQAVRIIQKLEKHQVNLEFVEQPVRAEDIDGLFYVKHHVYTDILADESVFSPQDALKIIHRQAADMLNIKLAKAGGILPASKIYTIGEAAQVECLVGCMLESHIAVSAAVHFACSKKLIVRSDLDPSFLILENPIESSVSLKDNALVIDDSVPGLGIKHINGLEYIV